MKNSIKKNAYMNMLLNISNIAFPIITFPYIARRLSVNGIGIVNFYNSIGTYACMFAALGVNAYGIRAVAKVRDDKRNLERVVSEILTLECITSFIVCCFFGIICSFSPKLHSNIILLVLQFLLIILNPASMNWFFSGIEDYSFITKRTVVIKVLSLFLVLIFIKDEKDFIIYGVISVGAILLNEIINVVFLFRFLHINLDYKGALKHLRPMVVIFGSIMAISVYTYLDTIMLGIIRGDEAVGYYTLSTKTKTILLALINSLSTVLLPRLSYYIENKKNAEYVALLRKAIELISVIVIPITVFCILEANAIVRIIGGEGFMPSILCTRILLLVLIISGYSNITGIQILLPYGRDKQFTIAVFIGALVDILLNILLISRYSYIGAAIATVVAELAQAIIQTFFARDKLFGNMNYKTIFKTVLSTAICGGAVVGIKIAFHNSILELFVSFAIYLIGFTILARILKIGIFIEYFEMIKHKIFPQRSYIG